MGCTGIRWCALPALVDEFAAAKSLVQLMLPGWPRAIGIDLLNKNPPGVAGSWLRRSRAVSAVQMP
jgi:hypothetical protein